jgi:hypothetical protein
LEENLNVLFRGVGVGSNPTSDTSCHVYECDSRPGFRLEIGFINHFTTRLVITHVYSAIAVFHALLITTAHVRSNSWNS